MSRVFGIDLGTTYSCIAYIDDYGKPVVLKNSDGDHTTPSVAMVESGNNIIVGNEAKRSIELEPERTVQFIKRKIGKENDTFTIDGVEYHAPEISAWILKKIVGDANEELRQTGVLLNRTKNLLDDVLLTAEKQGYPISRIDKVLLVGGSSRMPQVAAMIEKNYHVTPILSDPDEAVAKGAAIYAGTEKNYNDFVESEARRTGKSIEEINERNLVTGEIDRKFAASASATIGGMKLNITNVLSRTYGIGTLDENQRKFIRNMLMINDKLPATMTETFYTVSDNQTGVVIKLYESRAVERDMDIDDKKPITEISMRFKSPVPAATPVKMTLALDNSGIIHIIAEEQLNHSKLDTTFELSNQMSKEDISNAARRMSLANVE